jgi:hypothetical protein
VHPGHLARVACVEPAEKTIDLLTVYWRGISDADKVEAEGKGFLLYLFRNRHFLRIVNGCDLYYIAAYDCLKAQ